MQLLGEHSANLNAQEKDTLETPLHIASESGDAELVRLLGGLSANLEAVSSSGYTPAFAASRNGHVEVLQLLSDLGANT